MKTLVLLLFVLQSMPVAGAVRVETQTLRLQFGDSGDLLRVEACFPGCSDKNAKSRVLSAERGMFLFNNGDTPELRSEREHQTRPRSCHSVIRQAVSFAPGIYPMKVG
jgi:hypothetical protein